jgi:hypothetical protein
MVFVQPLHVKVLGWKVALELAREKIFLCAHTHRMGHRKHHTKGRLSLTVKSGVLAPNHHRPTQKLLKIETFAP